MESFFDGKSNPPVCGYVHRSADAGDVLVLAHGAGSNCNAPLLIAIAEEFAGHGITVLRCDLPFRQEHAFGPPRSGHAARDRDGLRNAVTAARRLSTGRVFLGGHSYGGRQATMLCAEEAGLVTGLLLLSYPLHPPRKPEQLRTQHFLHLKISALFVHGTRDPFGSIEAMQSALKLIPAKTALLTVDGAGHDLGFKGKAARNELPGQIRTRFAEVFG
jgi:predicted alpha/beta-hydrolase family hydrolase